MKSWEIKGDKGRGLSAYFTLIGGANMSLGFTEGVIQKLEIKTAYLEDVMSKMNKELKDSEEQLRMLEHKVEAIVETLKTERR